MSRSIAIVAALVVALGVVVLVGSLSATHGHTAKSNLKIAQTPSHTPTPSPVAVTAKKAFTLDSSTTDQRQLFATASGEAWDLDWSYDCARYGGRGMFIVSIYDGAGRASTETPPVIQSGAGGGSGVQHYHQSGTHFFGVRSQCTWRLTVKGGS